MTRVTDYFGISKPVPFVDVHVERDNLIFLDPSAIRNGTDRHSVDANAKLIAFFGQVVAGVTSKTAAQRTAARALLNHLHEPNETRLGMSKGSPKGSAFGDELTQELWDELERNPAAQHAVLTRLEETRLFINWVGADRISDMTTRIIFDILAAFTADMMTTYPALKAGAVSEETHVWDQRTARWGPVKLTLPYAGGKQLLLVPTHWVFWRTLMDVMPFYNRYATQVIADEQTHHSPNGKVVRPSKARIKRENPHVRELNNEKAVECKAEHDRDLVGEYRSYVDQTFEPLTDQQIRDRTD